MATAHKLIEPLAQVPPVESQPEAPLALAQQRPLRPITPGQFAQLCVFIKERSGIHLTEAKQALLVGRLTRRLRANGLTDFASYYELLLTSEEEVREMLDCISTNETYFFREPKQFEFLENEVFPQWKARAGEGARSKHIRVWSAGCSTGEEPYTLAITLEENFPRSEGWTYEILATDISTRVLRTAEQGVWSIDRARGVRPDLLQKYMMRGTGENQGRVRVVELLKQHIRFERLNLKEYHFTRGPEFDLILCRNVLIYFDQEFKNRVTSGLISRLKTEGYLFLGHAEALTTDRRFAKVVVPTIVQRT